MQHSFLFLPDMAAQKPSIPSGTRDFGPLEVQKRKYLLQTIERVFKQHGYMPLETPALENLSSLEGKYGEEGDRLLYSIVESGDYFSESSQKVFRFTYYLVRFLKRTVDYIFDKSLRYESIGEPKVDSEKEFCDFLSTHYITLYKGRLIEALDKESHLNLDLIAKEVSKLSHFIYPLIVKLKEIPNLDNERIEFIFNQFWTLPENKVNFENLFDLVNTNYNSKTVKKSIASKGLRYDLTVPFARYVVMNRNNISFPFKRYQMQPVWRADRPQKGRYREFWQCDADVVGSDSLFNELDLIQIYHEAFSNLRLTNYELRINNRKILAGIAEYCEAPDRLTELTIALDKIDKIGTEGVKTELEKLGFTGTQITKISSIADFKSTDNNEKISFLENLFNGNATGLKGIEELKFILSQVPDSVNLSVDFSLARGLSYYTGCILEVVSNEGTLKSSIGGGGRYDNLTGVFGLPGVSGVGISFGLDRIYDVMDELNLFPPDITPTSTRVLFCCFDEAAQRYALNCLQQVREAGIAAELYPDVKKIGKQLDYANHLKIPFAAIIGDTEMQSGQLTLKDLHAGTQETLRVEQIIDKLNSH